MSQNLKLMLDRNILPHLDSCKDLGVIIDNKLKFDLHINNIVSRAQKRANLIHKCFTSKDSTTLVSAFTTYVRPLLEYASCVWSPHSSKLIHKIESVQRRFTKRLPSCRNLRYSARLKKLNINSLEIRRLHCDLIYTYKIIFGLVDTDTSVFFNLRNSESRTRGHNYKLYVPQSRLDIHKYSFSHRTLQCWNSVPATSSDFSSLSAFKRLLYACDLSRFTIGGT